MNSEFRKTAITVGLVIFGLGTAYSAQLVNNEIVFLHAKPTTPVQTHSEHMAATWAHVDSATFVTATLSTDAIQEVLGAKAASGSIATQ